MEIIRCLQLSLYFYISQETYFVSNYIFAQYASELKKEKKGKK